MFTNMLVDGVSIYHPENKVDNSFFIEYFQSNFNKDITSLLRHLRRKERFLVNNDQENALTMGIAAAKNVLLETHTEPHEIDMIVFVSDTPEYFVPSNALLCIAESGGLLFAD